MDKAAIYAPIIKADKQPDGSLIVSGVATDSSLDSDEQRCDPEWLKQAMPAWFTWGNVRQMHGSIAAGVATELVEKDGAHHIVARIVDADSVRKIEAGVLKGFSIGIRNPRIRADKSAPGGLITSGEVVEVSVVDRPANGSCRLTIAKSAHPGLVVNGSDFDPTTGLVRVEEFHEDVTKSADPDAPESTTPAPVEPTDTPEVPAADDAPVAPVEGAGTDASVVPAGEGEAVDASVTPEAAPVEAEAEPVAVEPETAPEPVEAEPEPSVKAATLDEAAIRDLVSKSVAEAVAAHLQAAPVAVLDAEPAPVVKAAGPTDVPVEVLEHFSARAAALGVPWTVEKGAAHDPLFLATVRNGILACIIAEAREAMRGEDETIDMGILMRSLQSFLAWWNCEAVAGEAPASVDTPGPDLSLVTVIEDPAPVSVSGPDRDGVMVASPVSDDPDLDGLDAIVGDMDLGGGVVVEKPKAAAPSDGCGCCDKCTHSTKAATPDPAPVVPAPVVKAAVLKPEPGPELVDLPKGTSEAFGHTNITIPDGTFPVRVTETPAEAGSKTATPDTTKAALAEAMEPVLTEVRALRAENDALLARLGRVEKAAAPGGPVRVRPVTADQAARAGDEFRAKAAALRQVGRTVDDPGLAAEYERKALEFDAKAVESGQVRAVTA